MKTIIAIVIVAGLATGAIKQDLVKFEPGVIVDKTKLLSCYYQEFDNRKQTQLKPAEAKAKCKIKLKLDKLEQAIEEHDYELVQELVQ